MSLLFKILNYLIHIPLRIKVKYKLAKFKAYAKMGDNVTLGPMANITKAPTASITIGNNCDLLCNLVARSNGCIKIGDYTTIRGYSVIGAVNKILIGNYVIISNNVHIYDNNNHPTDPQRRIELSTSGFYSEKWAWEHSESAPVVIEDNVWIGERSTILKGVHIGKGAIVACDSVVTKDVPENCIAAGNPAKIVKRF